ncbi:MAG: serine hydrolase domain-containing protein [Pseudomonadota bacterium]
MKPIRGPRSPAALAAITLAAFAPLTQAQACAEPAPSAAIDTALVPVVSFEGEEGSRLTLEERRDQLGVPAASVAVLRDGEIAWARAYGEGVDEETLFQMASLSKPVAAAGILTLAFERGVGLDQDLSDELPGLDRQRLNPDGLPITLRGLLSHTNGTTVSGFPGYPMDKRVPTTKQIIEGSGPANSKPVVVEPNPEGERRYSGGGYTVAQWWAEQASGEDFPSLMRRLVLDPLGMERSTFATAPAPDFARDNVARGYLATGEMIAGGWRLHPEHAAASLWSTPREYLLFVRALMRALDGDEDVGIAPAVAAAMTTPIASAYGLGIGVADIKGAIRLSHSGSNIGYKSNFMAYPDGQNAVISVTNSERGWPMVGDIGRTANTVYDWPRSDPIERTRMRASDEDAQALLGDYAREGSESVAFTLTAELPILVGTAPSGYRFELVKTGKDTFIDPQDGEEGTFIADGSGGWRITFGDTIYVKASEEASP